MPKEQCTPATRNQSGMVTAGRFTTLWRMLVQPALRGYLLALGGYLLLSLLVLAPLLPHFGNMIPGGPVAAVDGWQNVWNLWWVHQALTSGTNPFHTDYLYYPEGVDLHLQTLNISNGLLILPITALVGPIAGYNTALLLAFVLAGLGGYALALQVSGHQFAAFVGGALFAFSPFHMTKVWDGQLELIALQWLAFYALFLLRTVELRRWREALLAGIFLALIGYTSWYYLLFFAIYSLLFVVLWLVTLPGWHTRWTALTRTALVPLVGGGLLLPILLPALRDVQGEAPRINPNSSLDLILIHSANVFDFWLPSAVHPLWGGAVEHLGQTWHPFIAGWNLSLGYSILALAVLGGVTVWRVAWRWWALTLTALLLALGPLLHVGTARTALYLPYTLLLHLPGVGIARRPSHFAVIATLLFAPLVALGLRWLFERIAPIRHPLLVTGLALLLILEYMPPRWPLLDMTAHPYYATLTGQEGALMDLPPRDESSEPLQAQMVHGMPILGGFVSRTPSYPFVKVTPGVRQLWQMRADGTSLLPADTATRLVALNFYDIRQIIVHWQAVDPAKRAGLEAVLAQMLPEDARTYTDMNLSAYQVPQVEERPFAYFGTNWYPEETIGERHWRWMPTTGEIIMVNPTGEPAGVLLMLQMQSYQEQRDVALMLNGQSLGYWEITPTPAIHQLHFLLPPGEQRLQLRAPTAQEENGPRNLSIVVTEAEFYP